jgi:hypothetical protein
MSKQYPGGYITKLASTPNIISAPGIWTLDQAAQYISDDSWPGLPSDPNFNNVTLLLNGNNIQGRSNNCFIDSSPSKMAFTRSGNTTQGSFNPHGPLWSNYFDGNNYIYYDVTTSNAPGTDNFSVECFVNVTNNTENRGICQFSATSTGLQGSSSATLMMQLYNGNWWYHAGNESRGPYGTVVPNRWYHVIITRFNSTTYLIVDGTALHAFGDSTNYSTARYVAVGGGYASGYLGKCYISNFRYIKGFAPYIGVSYSRPTSPLTNVQGTQLLTCNSNRTIDTSLNNVPVTRSGTTLVKRLSPFNPPSKYETSNSDIGWSNFFNINTDHLQIPYSSQFAFDTGDFTVECWVNFNSRSTTFSPIIMLGTGVDAIPVQRLASWALYADNSANTLVFNRYTPTNIAVSFSWTPVLNRWYHIAVSRSGTSFRAFIDGAQIGTTQTSTTNYSAVNTSDPLVISRFIASGGVVYGFNGYISNVRVLKGTAVYTSNFLPSTTPLTAITNTALLTCNSSTIVDNSTNSFSITRNGLIPVEKFSPFHSSINENTVLTRSVYFNGASVITASNTVTNFGTGDFTVECWFRTNVIDTSSDTIISNYNNASGGSIGVYINRGTSGGIQVYQGTGNTLVLNAPSVITATNTWYHIAVARSSGVSRLFLNGILMTTATDTSNYGIDNSVVAIGGASVNGVYGSFFQGLISNLRVVKGTALYTNFTPPTAPLTAITNTQLLTSQSNRFVDNSSNAFTVTSTGDTSVQPFSQFAPTASWNATINGGSAYFDGSGDYISAPASGFALPGDFTVEAWVYIAGNSPLDGASQRSAVIASTMQTSNPVSGFTFYIGGNSAITGIFLAAEMRVGGIVTGYSTSVSIPQGVWNHIAFVRTGTTLTYYLNGINVGSSSGVSQNIPVNNALTIGGQTVPSYTRDLNGYISNLRIVSGTGVYTGNFTPPTALLTAITNTSLLLNFANAGIYNAVSSNVIETVGNAQVSTVQSKWGGSSIAFDGSGDRLVSAPSPLNVLDSGNFTIEFWLYPNNTASAYRALVSSENYPSTTGGWTLYQNGTSIEFWITGSLILGSGSLAITASTWQHLALCRASGTLRLFINGTSIASVSNSTSLTGRQIWIGDNNSSGGGLYFYNGYIDDLRITHGVARYITNFTAPTQAFSNVASGDQFLSNVVLLLADNGTNSSQNNTFIDSSTNNFTITRVGNTTQGTFSPFSQTGWSNYFDGTGDYLSVPSNSAIVVGSSDFTVEAWIYLTTTGPWTGYIFGKRAGSGSLGIILGFEAASVPRLLASVDGSNWNVLINSSISVTPQTWTHIAATRSGNSWRLFVNGQQGATATVAGTVVDSGANLTIGANAANGTSVFPRGYISNFRLVKGTALYTSSFIPSQTPLTPLTPVTNTALLTCQTNVIQDRSSNNFSITNNNNAVIDLNSPFTETSSETALLSEIGSLYFDGAGDSLIIQDNLALEPENSNLTWEMWINTTVTAQYSTLFSRYASSFGAGSWTLLLNNTASAGNVAMWFSDFSGSTPLLLSSGVNVCDARWHHIAVVRNGSSWVLYVDGVSRATATWSGTVSNITPPVLIGADSVNGRNYIGYISNLRIVKGTALYTANFIPPTSSLTAVAGTSLLTCQNNLIVDNSSNGFNITPTSNVRADPFNPFTSSTLVPYNKFASGGSASFDGTGDWLSSSFNPSLNLGLLPFTFETWVYPNSVTGIVGLYAVSAGAGTVPKFIVHLDAGTPKVHYNGLTGGSNIYNNATTAIPVGSWSHIAFVRALDGKWTWFVNGIPSGTGTNTTDITFTSQPSYIGYGGEATFTPLNGYLSSMRLLANTTLYTTAFIPPRSPVVSTDLNTRLSMNFTNAGIVDSSCNTNIEVFDGAHISTVQSRWGGSSLYFDSSSDRLLFLNSPEYSFGTGNFTIEFWFNSQDMSGSTQRGFLQTSQAAGGLHASYTSGIAIYQGINGSNTPTTGGIAANVLGAVIGSSATFSPNTWHHLALVRSSGVVTLYVNGTANGSSASATVAGDLPHGNLVIGGYYSASYLYQGYIDDLRITRGVARYTANFTPPSAPHYLR